MTAAVDGITSFRTVCPMATRDLFWHYPQLQQPRRRGPAARFGQAITKLIQSLKITPGIVRPEKGRW